MTPEPGDHEDREGHPFVGPAGRLLDRALHDAGIDPTLVYATNAVKHFKFTRRQGKRRIHQKPGRAEVVTCRPWLIAEINSVRPQLVICLGATAAQSLLGAAFRISTGRGELQSLPGLAGSAGRPCGLTKPLAGNRVRAKGAENAEIRGLHHRQAPAMKGAPDLAKQSVRDVRSKNGG